MKKSGMMMLFLMIAGSLLNTSAWAKEEPKKDQGASQIAPQSVLTPEQQQAENEKRALVANIMEMRNQELRVGVLEQLYNQEIMALRQKQAVFCDLYKLDIEKFRKGQYQYDEKTGKFVEKSVQEDAKE